MLIESEVKTEWIKVPPSSTPLIFVGRDILCLGKGCHLMIYNIITHEENVYTANNYEHGDGVECYAGHRNIPILAFAEKALNPRIIIITCPDFTKLRIIANGAAEGYCAMTFSEQTYLITLSSLPLFELAIWNWRTTEKLLAVETEVFTSSQILNCSIHAPISIVQYSENESNFVIWDAYNSYKHMVAIKHKVEMPDKDKILSFAWNAEGTLFVLNKYGCVYQMNSEYVLEIIIYGGTTFGSQKPCFCWYKGGLIVLLTNMDIKYFKKSSGTWYEEWSVTPYKLNQLLTCSGRDYVIGWSECAEIMELDLNKHCFVCRKNYLTINQIFCLIYPTCNYFASLTPCDASKIKIWDSFTGNLSGSLAINGVITLIDSNPVYPYLVVGLSSGTLMLINCHNVENPKILTNFHLYHYDISKIIFNENGDIMVTANLYYGLFFVIKGLPGTKMEILHFIDYRRQTIDIAMNEDDKYINVYILVQTEECSDVSQRIVLKSISKSSNRIKKRKFISNKYKFTHLYVLNNNIFIGKLFHSKFFCVLDFLKKSIKVVNEIHSGHYLRYFLMDSDNDHIFTYGYDGLIIIRSKDAKTIIGALLPHHRFTGGVEKVIVDPFMRYAISYGLKSHELVCSKFLQKTVEDRVVKESMKKFIDMRPMFSELNPTIGYEIPGDAGKPCKTYLEMRRQEIIKMEETQQAKERQAIMEEFLVLKNEVITLLEANLNGPEIEKIDILEFYQHTLLRQHKEEINRIKCEWTVAYYKDLIRAQEEVWHTMKKKFYDSMEVTGTLIKGIFSNFSVESYSILPGATKFVQFANIAAMFREYEDMLREGDLLKPWETVPENVFMEMLEQPPVIQVKSESARIKEALDDIELEELSTTNLKTAVASYPSNTVSLFIEPSNLLYDQDEIHAYTQIILHLKLMEHDHEILKNLFNDKYDELKQRKVRDLNIIVEKSNRLRFILSELNYHNLEIIDPIWHHSEYVENIITVKDSEVGITPYITPSEQALLDWQAAEEERIRLLLLADDFRERALIKMMDGVLEIRWEDTLKRDIPKPKCMLEKEPEKFNEEDLRAIKDYEEKVIFLNSERQMYRNMLDTEYTKTAEQVREVIRKFNTKLREILLYKIKIESARMQQSFIIQRIQNKCILRLKYRAQEHQIIEDMKNNDKHITEIQQKISVMSDAYLECKNAGDALQVKDKLLERNFKRDIQEFSALIQEQSYKLFRKQPKMSIKGINMVSLLVELGTCCVSQEKSVILTQDCIDYLRSIDNLDQYVGVPNTIDETLYKIICKYRRFRIENDLKTKANGIEQNDVEQTIQAFQKYLTSQKEIATKLAINLQKKRTDLLEFIHDKKMQIVITKGLVEIPTNGTISDYDNAILIHRKDVETINEIILRAGARKLKVMNDKMIHRRGILMKEWEHKKLKMQIEDLNEQLHIIKHVKVTKEIQQYLRQRAKGESYDIGTLTLDQEIESQKKSYEKIIFERQTAINELDKQIKEYKKKNKILDNQIAEINIDVCEQQESRDLEFEHKYKQDIKNRMTAIVKRSKLVKQIQDQHNEILVLQTELELLRLKTYPTLKFKTLF